MGYDLLNFLKEIRGSGLRTTPEIQTSLNWIRELDKLSVKQKQRIAMAKAVVV